MHILTVIARHALASVLGARLVRWPGLARRLSLVHLSGPERLRCALEDLGGTFIKFGQMLALQPDILSLEYCNALFNLLDRVAPFGYEQVVATFQAELGRSPSEIFDRIEPQPLATASIGQVHLAWLKGVKLAVKVQRPSVEVDFAGDIRLMAATIRLVKRLGLRSLYWMIEPMSEFIDWTREELDFRNEARYMQRLRRNAEDNAQEHVPQVFWEATTRRTLVAEFLEGETVLAYLRAREVGGALLLHRLKAAGFDAHRVASNIIDNFLGDVFRHGMFHADLHPANLMILPNNVVGYIDFGITGTISRYSRQRLIALTLAYTRGDLEGMCDSFFGVSALDARSDVEKFRAELKRLAGSWYALEGKERRLRKNFTLVMLDMLRLSRLTNIWPERDVIKYIRSAIAIDGLITRFAPGFNVGQYLEMVCARYLKWQVRKEFLSYETFAGWVSANGHMLRDGAFRAQNFLDMLSRGEIPAHPEPVNTGAHSAPGLRQRAMQLALSVLALSLLMALTGEHVQFGVNLFTAELTFIACAVMLFLRTVHSLAEEG
jgi:ubiquinone biosynthesis protein